MGKFLREFKHHHHRNHPDLLSTSSPPSHFQVLLSTHLHTNNPQITIHPTTTTTQQHYKQSSLSVVQKKTKTSLFINMVSQPHPPAHKDMILKSTRTHTRTHTQQGKSKKKFIDPANSQHFHLVHRSQRDVKCDDPDASQFVLLPGRVSV
jgi:hypothetical protein